MSQKGLLFFKVHGEVEHFMATTKLLIKAWETQEAKVREAFDFIAKHQAKMWRKLSEIISDYPEDLGAPLLS